jgi:hypothetical protein
MVRCIPLVTRTERQFAVNLLGCLLVCCLILIPTLLYFQSGGPHLSEYAETAIQIQTLLEEREREQFLYESFMDTVDNTLSQCEAELASLSGKLESELLEHARLQKHFENIHAEIHSQAHPSSFLLTPKEVQLWEKRKEMLFTHCQEGRALPKPYLFIHLAKTGGTSIYNIVVGSKIPMLHFWQFPSQEEVIESGLDANVIGGHVSHGFHKWWNMPPWNSTLSEYTYFTILRHPVERVISHYLYHLSRPSDPNYFRVVNRTLVEWTQQVKQGLNAMTAYLSGAEYGAWWNRYDPDFGLTMLPHYADPPEYYVVTEKHYMRARENLIQSVVGIQENLPIFVKQLEQFFKLGIDLRKSNTRSNVGTGEDLHLTPQDIAVVTSMNHWDMELYELAVMLFRQQEEIINFSKGTYPL